MAAADGAAAAGVAADGAAADGAAADGAAAEGGGARAGEKAVCFTWRGDAESVEKGVVTMMGGMDGMVET